ncbi:MAG: U32 family peptidase, partial [Oscillospiraceae bacterium]|nr:U32 family peptidase [Oscillospiraceae bacterium]
TQKEISECAGLGVELEVFVHGSLCMSVSGQCYLSAMLGGRSGNRGLCAQPCRLPFSAKAHPNTNDKALSLKDLSLYDYVKKMLSIGVCSLKIEGRMKRPEYVAGASACFAAARDAALGISRTSADSKLLADLHSVFSRSGFTDGYFTGLRGQSMFGARTHEDVTSAAPALGRLARLYDREQPTIPVKMTFTMRVEQPVTLTVQDKIGNSVMVYGDIPEPAINRALDKQQAEAQISKTGGTPFIAETECNISNGLNLPLSSINALRRKGLDKLLLKRGAPVPIIFNSDKLPINSTPTPLPFIKKTGKPFIIARFSDYKQIPDNDHADMIFVPSDTPFDKFKQLADNRLVGIEIPRGLFSDRRQTEKQIKNAVAAGIKTALCGNIGAIPLARQAGLYPLAGFGMNITNSHALDTMIHHGITAAVLSFELTFGQLRFAKEASIPCGIMAYGRLPLMLLRNCPVGATSGCTSCGGSGGLTDRRGIRFPVVCKGGCAELLNSTPLWLADELDGLPELDFLLLHFTDESPSRAAEVISAYRSGGEPPKDFTRGLYKRGVE